MANYFTGIGKSGIGVNTATTLSKDEVDFEALLRHYKSRTHYLDTIKEDVDNKFIEWINLLFIGGYNIVVHGPESKYRLLETFRQKHLGPGKIYDSSKPPTMNGQGMLNMQTVKLHGFTPVSVEQFCHALFGVTGTTRESLKSGQKHFISKTKKEKHHYVFMIHTFELFYKESKPVCEIIFELCKQLPQNVHIIMSSDHINSGKILSKLKLQLNLQFYIIAEGESFLHEKLFRITGIEGERNGADGVIDRMFEGHLTLQSLKDIYLAVQHAIRQIMIYIFEKYVEVGLMIEEAVKLEAMDKDLKQSGRYSTRRTTIAKPESKPENIIKFNQLLSHCESNFIVRRGNLLREHLGELVDHGVIEFNESSDIVCLVSVETCKKFLSHIKASD